MNKRELKFGPEKQFRFASYYKYSFTFVSDDGWTIRVGGNGDDIYRSSVDPTMTWQQIQHEFDTGDEDYLQVWSPEKLKVVMGDKD